MLLSFLIVSCSQQEEPQAAKTAEVITELRNNLGPGCGVKIIDQCDPPNIQTLSFTLNNVAGYLGCTFTISVTLSECNEGGDILSYIGDFQLVTYNCPQYTIDLQNAINAGGTVLTDFI